MSNTITLPDTISFEEIAEIWCKDFEYQRAVRFMFSQIGFFEFSVSRDKSFSYVEGNIMAIFIPYARTLSIKNSEKFQPILDYIKERSNG